MTPTTTTVPRSFVGRTREEAIANAEKQLGGPVKVLLAADDSDGGVWGFFEKRRFSVLAQLESVFNASAQALASEDALIEEISPEALLLAEELAEVVANSAPLWATEELAQEMRPPAPEVVAPIGKAWEEWPVEPVEVAPVVEPEPQPEPVEVAPVVEPEPQPEPVEVAPVVEPEPQPVEEGVVFDNGRFAAQLNALLQSDTSLPAPVTPSPRSERPVAAQSNEIEVILLRSGLSRSLAAKVAAQVGWLGDPQDRLLAARTALVSMISSPSSISALRALLIVGAEGSGRSTLVANLLQTLPSEGLAVASVGSPIDPGTSELRQIAHDAGVFHTWMPRASDPALAVLAQQFRMVLVDLDSADPLINGELIAAAQRSVQVPSGLLLTVPAGGAASDISRRIASCPVNSLAGAAITFGDRMQGNAEIIEVAATSPVPVLFVSGRRRLIPFDAASLAAQLLPGA